ncbi:probable transcription factor At1g61730 [Prosopis cineraria]|uniref:probable transcription factor At1g61730 n=1 Tax=Prosopis cineraria TaxID=364024 RepID=UPI00240F2FBA|nr:probable transcription factor At1g61730 [Prosopis cineraria]XP_054808777.1 probable transcription factor At1g61730 [Prosopis cineraria]
MAPKRASPLDEPPSASSSSEEEEASSEVGSSSEDDDQPSKLTQPLSAEKKPTSKKPPPAAPIAKSQPKASVSDSETESDAESDSDDERPSENADLIVKPIASKPKGETPKGKKSKSQPSVTPAKAANKRPSDNNRPATDSKKAKKGKDAGGNDEILAAEEDGRKAGDESKKLFQRLWSEDDEIAILMGLAEYAAKTGEAPLKDINGFHDFIKKSVHVDVSNEQLANKIRTLKRKYVKNSQKGKNGEGPSFSKPYDKKVFELSKKIWPDEGANGGIDLTKSNGKEKKNKKEGNSVVASRKREPDLVSDSKEVRKIDIDPHAGSPLSLSEMIRFNKSLGLSGLDDDVIKRGYELIGASKKAELDDRWKKLQIAELELFVKRVELVKDEASLIWEATKSSGN